MLGTPRTALAAVILAAYSSPLIAQKPNRLPPAGLPHAGGAVSAPVTPAAPASPAGSSRVRAGPTAGPLAGTRWIAIPGNTTYRLVTGSYTTPPGGFEIMTTEVTGAIWAAVPGVFSQGVGDGRLPRTDVSLSDILVGRTTRAGLHFPGWLEALNSAEAAAGRTQYTYRLPTTPEWEAAARGQPSYASEGIQDDHDVSHRLWCRTSSELGDATNNVDVTAANLDAYAWFGQSGGPREVAGKASCGGLFDMFGNADEWTYTNAGGYNYVVRGGNGGIRRDVPHAVSTARLTGLEDTQSAPWIGFRLLREPRQR